LADAFITSKAPQCILSFIYLSIDIPLQSLAGGRIHILEVHGREQIINRGGFTPFIALDNKSSEYRLNQDGEYELALQAAAGRRFWDRFHGL